MSRRTPRRSGGSSLVITLLVITVLSIIVVAFMQSMSIERSTARSYANIEQATLATEAGKNLLLALLSEELGTNLHYAVGQTNDIAGLAPPLLLTTSDFQTSTNLLPLLSGDFATYLGSRTNDAALASFLSARTNDDPIALENLNVGGSGNRLIRSDAPESYPVTWIYLSNNSRPVARYAFYCTDQSARLNLAAHGRETNARTNWASPAEELPIAIPGTNTSGQTVFLTPTEAAAARALPDDSLRPGVEGNLFDSREEYQERKHLVSIHAGEDLDIIPPGYRNATNEFVIYPDGGKPKYNLNELATNTNFGVTETDRATNIAGIIDDNLPLLKDRDPSFSEAGDDPIRYVQRLAASIVDYIDTNNTPTLLPDGEPAGRDLFPLPVTIVERYNWVSETGSGTSWTVRIAHQVFVELWNPYTEPVEGELIFELETLRPVMLTDALEKPLEPHASTNVVSLDPNEMLAVDLGSVTNEFNVFGDQPSADTSRYPSMDQTSSKDDRPGHSRYKAYWEGVLIDRTANDSGLHDERAPGLKKDAVGNSSGTRIALNDDSRWSVNIPNVVNVSPKGFRSVGDPRQNYLANYVWETLSYANANVRFNGRHNGTGVTRQDFDVTWDARDRVRSAPPLGTHRSNEQPPSSAPPMPEAMDDAVAFIRNGPMLSIAELGNIYDPAHLNDVGFSTEGGNPSSHYASGGGRTLRIGQPEFDYPDASASPSRAETLAPPWDEPGRRSLQLLDLFTVNETNAHDIPATTGRININTAPREVLAALLYELAPASDAGIAVEDPVIPWTNALGIADAIITNRPYLSVTELTPVLPHFVQATNFAPAITAHPDGTIDTMDRAREEVFAKIVNLLSTRSPAIRAFVVGQALNPDGDASGQAIAEFLIQIEPIDEAGNLRLRPTVTFEKWH